jgi:hypothetical protein
MVRKGYQTSGELMKRSVYRVMYEKEGNWVVYPGKRVKNTYISSWDTKSEAVNNAKSFAKEEWRDGTPSQVVVHKIDGKIQTEYTYGKDPRKTKG